MFLLGAGFDFDSTSGEVMLRRVRDEVCRESLDKDRVAGGAGRFECDDRLELAQVVGSQRLADSGRDVDGLVTDKPAPAKGELHSASISRCCCSQLAATSLAIARKAAGSASGSESAASTSAS